MAKMDESIGVAQNAEQSIRMMSFTVPLVQMIIITTAMMERYKMTMAKENMKHFRCAVDQKNCTKSISIFNDAKKSNLYYGRNSTNSTKEIAPYIMQAYRQLEKVDKL